MGYTRKIRPGMTIYHTDAALLEYLSADEVKGMILTLLQYSKALSEGKSFTEPEYVGLAQGVWNALRTGVESGHDAYEKKREKNIAARAKGVSKNDIGRPASTSVDIGRPASTSVDIGRPNEIKQIKQKEISQSKSSSDDDDDEAVIKKVWQHAKLCGFKYTTSIHANLGERVKQYGQDEVLRAITKCSYYNCSTLAGLDKILQENRTN